MSDADEIGFRDPMRLERALDTDVGLTPGDWRVDGKDWEDAFRIAVDRVRQNPGAEKTIFADRQFVLRVRWNEPTETVRVDVFVNDHTRELKRDTGESQ